jgi:hypothetical protein
MAKRPRKQTFRQRVEAAAQARGTSTREGLVLDNDTGGLSDAMAWELEQELLEERGGESA